MTSFFDTDPTWRWPDEPQTYSQARQRTPYTTSSSNARTSTAGGARGSSDQGPSPSAQPEARPRKTYPPRTCRICLETVDPTFEAAAEGYAGMFAPTPSVQYVSPDPAAGRLIRPCKCKGSSRYVHEGCLQSWRHADPEYGKRNYWQCPTCGFRYRLERMKWAAWISSTGTQIGLTALILYTAIFLLGFVADPIINLYLDPYNTISSVPLSRLNSRAAPSSSEREEPATWAEHFLKGVASLGLLSFIKVLLAMSPWQWWNLRSSGLMSGSGGRAAGSGRDRLASISWFVVLIGVGTFIWGVYKAVRAWSRRWLQKAGERVMDVQLDDNDDDDDEDVHAEEPRNAPPQTGGPSENWKDR